MDISLLVDHQQDAHLIAKWYLVEWGHSMPETVKTTLTEKVLLGANKDTFPMTILAHMDQALVGVAELKYRELEQYPNWHHWLDGVYVPSEHRGKGVSSKLILEAIAKAKHLKVQSLYLRCEDHNIALYEKYGFVSVKTEMDRVGNNDVRKTVMVLTISENASTANIVAANL
ncbi:acetyltransferase [Marinomonas sp. SBI22]|uniref:GNAT family N-acetyltransferase n=1 Tax=unclassified Marinomonas TaxID=196814 RepID=UPI0007AF9F49|nr:MULTISPECIES: GNAT family N-acetyltransferase [unclassified Marinomonas]KZM42467.1 acetyltransferase [Marinomonas sp. SBI22]KZM43861.1 acetyltransferase [Marinomonas sp. SBI8L]